MAEARATDEAVVGWRTRSAGMGPRGAHEILRHALEVTGELETGSRPPRDRGRARARRAVADVLANGSSTGRMAVWQAGQAEGGGPGDEALALARAGHDASGVRGRLLPPRVAHWASWDELPLGAGAQCSGGSTTRKSRANGVTW